MSRALLARALADPERGIAEPPQIADEALELLAARAGGDARTALGALERAVEAARAGGGEIDLEAAEDALQRKAVPLRQAGRPALRLRLGLDQGDPRLRPRRLGLLPGGDARGRRGPALHRPPDGDPRLRGHRQRRPAGAASSRPRPPRRSTASACPSAGSTSPRPPSTWRWRRSRTPRSRRSARPARGPRARREAAARLPARRRTTRARRQLGRGAGLRLLPRRARRRRRPAAAARGGPGRALLRADRPRLRGRAAPSGSPRLRRRRGDEYAVAHRYVKLRGRCCARSACSR